MPQLRRNINRKSLPECAYPSRLDEEVGGRDAGLDRVDQHEHIILAFLVTLAVMEQSIDEIEAFSPGAYHPFAARGDNAIALERI